MGSDDFWTAERVALLIERWNEGDTANEIASALGHGCSRQKVCAKVYRLRKAGVPVAVRRRTWTRSRKLPDRVEASSKANRVVAPRERPALDDAAAPGTRKTIETLTPTSCRWPFGDPLKPEFHFCGARKVPGLPYCALHVQVAYVSAPARRIASATEATPETKLEPAT